MAQRRSLESYDHGDDEYQDGSGLFGGGRDMPPMGAPVSMAPPGGGGRVDEFGNEVPDFANDPNYPGAFSDYIPTEIAGNGETAREIGGGWNKPTTPLQNQPNQSPGPQLPRGVSVEETNEPSYSEPSAPSFFDEQPSSYSSPGQDTPAMSMSPDPITSHQPEPMQTSTGPTRRSVSNAAPALFQEAGGGSRMFGSAGGLMGGGKGAVGTNAGGPSPTEMMLSILRQMRGGG